MLSASFFFVAGVAFLTLVINANTCPWLVGKLGIIATSSAKKELQEMLHQQLVAHAQSSGHPEEVTKLLTELLRSVAQGIRGQQTKKQNSDQPTMKKELSNTTTMEVEVGSASKSIHVVPGKATDSAGLVKEYKAVRRQFNKQNREEVDMLGTLPEMIVVPTEDHLLELVLANDVNDVDWAKQDAVLTSFLNLVSSSYWSFFETRDLQPGSTEAEVLLASASLARSEKNGDLLDFFYVLPHVMLSAEDIEDGVSAYALAACELRTTRASRSTRKTSTMTRGSEGGITRASNVTKSRVASHNSAISKDSLGMPSSSSQGGRAPSFLNSGVPMSGVASHNSSISKESSSSGMGKVSFQGMSRNISGSSKSSCPSPTGSDVGRPSSVKPGTTSTSSSLPTAGNPESRLGKMVYSTAFQCLMSFLILANGLYIAIEEDKRNASNDDHDAWVFIEVFFTTVFFLEFVLKICYLGYYYFFDAWNNFDFVLVILGFVGLAIEFVASSDDDMKSNTQVSSEARIVRLARVFRVFRLLRLFRLVRLFMILKAKLNREEVSFECAEHMQKMTMLMSLARAHLMAQKEFMIFFCGLEEQITCVEVARCLLQSQAFVYMAMFLSVRQMRGLDRHMLQQVNNCRESKELTEELEHFVMAGYNSGVLGGKEADAILTPLRHHIRHCMTTLKDSLEGRRKSNLDLPDGEDEDEETLVRDSIEAFRLPSMARQMSEDSGKTSNADSGFHSAGVSPKEPRSVNKFVSNASSQSSSSSLAPPSPMAVDHDLKQKPKQDKPMEEFIAVIPGTPVE